MKVFSSSTISLEFDEIKKVLRQVWTGFSTSAQFREGIDETVKFVKANDVKYLISDTSGQKPVGPEDTKYAASVMPGLFGSGVKAMAFIMPKNVITKLALSSFAKEQGLPANVMYFDNIPEAEKWLFTF